MSSIQWSLASPVYKQGGSSRTAQLAGLTRNAELNAVLSSPEVVSALKSVPGLLDSLAEVPASNSRTDLSQDEQEILLIAAISLQHAFVQPNWTGPDLDFGPSDIARSLGADSDDASLNAAALPLLTLLGEPAYHLAAHPALLLLSIRVLAFLATQPSSLLTLPWWQVRSHLVHLALLDEAVALDESILSATAALIPQTPDADTAAAISLELGLLHHKLGSDRAANEAFIAAARASGLEFELTGAMGKKTKWQVTDHSQLLLLAESRDRGEDAAAPIAVPETLALNDDTLLEETEFTKVTRTGEGRLAHLDPANQPALHPLDQALLLSLCLAQSNSSPSDGLTAQQMMPFIARVISHPRNWSVHTVALLLRSRLESNRSRTVERATLQLAALIEQMPTSDSTPAERLQYFHQIPLPSKWEMERELAKRYLSLGVLRSALDIFTRLEMWEDAVAALQRMEREVEAERIVRDLLEGRKIESDVVVSLARSSLSDSKKQKLTSARAAKLWCVLGDLALGSDDAAKDPEGVRAKAVENYNKAWEISGHSSSRAMRSIAALHVSARELEAAIPAFQAALAINPLYAHSWFTLGVCFMRLDRWTEARDAFRRDVAVNEDDAEGWNNLAAVYLRINEEGLDGAVSNSLFLELIIETAASDV